MSKIRMGTSTLKPGERGNIDPGHPHSQEVFFVVRGHILFFDETQHYELHAGDAIWIPEGLSHTLINIGDEDSVLAWTGAPGA